jgi:hypothetical protein
LASSANANEAINPKLATVAARTLFFNMVLVLFRWAFGGNGRVIQMQRRPRWPSFASHMPDLFFFKNKDL